MKRQKVKIRRRFRLKQNLSRQPEDTVALLTHTKKIRSTPQKTKRKSWWDVIKSVFAGRGKR
jgi:hypothetical protein